MANSVSSGRLALIDAARGIAAMLVVLYHYTYRLQELYPTESLAFSFSVGHVGVHVFFVISGCVILMTLEKIRASGGGVREFVLARFWRLYPVFWGAVLITLASVSLLGLPGREVGAQDAVANFTMIPRLLGYEYVDGVYWSLEVELIYYAWMAVLYFLLPDRILPVALACWVLISTIVLVFAECSSVLKVARILLIADWIPYFVLGMAIYLHRAGRIGHLWLLAAISCFLAKLAISLDYVEAAVVGSCVWLIWAATAPERKGNVPKGLGFLLWLGAISYPLYLVHQNIGYALINQLKSVGVARGAATVIALAIVLVLSALITYGIEKPIMRWRAQRRRIVSLAAGLQKGG